MIHDLPTYPTFCVREKEMMKWVWWVNDGKGEQWSSNHRAPSAHASILEAQLKL